MPKNRVGKPLEVEARETIGIGSMVLLRLDENSLLSLTVAHANGNPDLGIISCNTPLAKAIIGRQAGETASYSVGDDDHLVEIIRVS